MKKAATQWHQSLLGLVHASSVFNKKGLGDLPRSLPVSKMLSAGLTKNGGKGCKQGGKHGGGAWAGFTATCAQYWAGLRGGV